MRRCIGCRNSFPQEKLLRFTVLDAKPCCDPDGRREGRGFYLCKNKECMEAAIKTKAFSRICKTNVDADYIREAINTIIDDTKED